MYQYLGLGVLYQVGDQVFHCILKQPSGTPWHTMTETHFMNMEKIFTVQGVKYCNTSYQYFVDNNGRIDG